MPKEVGCQNKILPRRGATYEILESVGRKVHMCHRCEHPNKRITSCLFETGQSARLTLVLNNVQLHTVVGQLAFLLSQPLRREWEIR